MKLLYVLLLTEEKLLVHKRLLQHFKFFIINFGDILCNDDGVSIAQ